MTLSRGPYSELDKMSLFQDLKLKRRKIDSRCSSDGESVAETSTSSPDLLAPMSPKMCDSGGGGSAGSGGGPGISSGGTVVAASLPMTTLAATSSVTTTTSTACSGAILQEKTQQQVSAEVVVATAKAVALAVAAKSEQAQQQKQQEQTDFHTSCGAVTATAAAASTMMSPPPPVRTSPAVSSDLDTMSSMERRTPNSARATPTPPHNNGNASSSSTSNGGGSSSSRASPDFIDEKIATASASSLMPSNGLPTNVGNTSAISATSSGGSMSVIRSVKEERILASPTRMLSYQQQQQNATAVAATMKGPTQSQQHVTVLVTPSRIKSEPTQAPHSPYSSATTGSASAASRNSPSPLPGVSSNPSTTHMHQPPAPQPHHTPAAAPAPPIVTTHHLHQQLTQPQMRKSSPPTDLQLPPQHHHLLSQSMQQLTQQQQLQLLQQAAAMSRQNMPGARELSPSASMSPSSRHSSSQSPQQQHLMPQQMTGGHNVRIKKEPTSLQNHSGNFGPNVSAGQRHHSPHHFMQQQPATSPQQSSSAPAPPPQLPAQALGNMAQALMHPASLQSLRHPNRDAAILFRVKNEVQQQVAAAAAAAAGLPQLMQPGAAAVAAAAAQRMVWVSNARINGVKPEVIGGPLSSIRPGGPGQSPSPHHSSSSTSSSQLSPQTPSQTPPRGTPTVIMGESCGVRTMVWGYEPAPPCSGSAASPSPNPHHLQTNQQSNQHQTHGQSGPGNVNSGVMGTGSAGPNPSHHTTQSSLNPGSSPSAGSLTPTHTPGPSPQNNEEAAQLLLSLGQTRIQDVRNRPPHTFRTPHALNMERLWAGDYSQLPPGQLHALNLSAAQQPWGSSAGGSNTTGLSRGLDVSHDPTDEDDQPLVCMICEDKATGLHYGIITCEG